MFRIKDSWEGKYQKTLGVDLVQMYVKETFLSHEENRQIFKSYVQEGFVKIVELKAFFNGSTSSLKNGKYLCIKKTGTYTILNMLVDNY